MYPSQTPEYRRKKYLERREKDLEKRRLRYAQDSEYRKKQISYMRGHRKRNAAQIRVKDRRRREQAFVNLEKKRIGRCQRCGYDKYLGALDWHHLDSNAKDFNPSMMIRLPEAVQRAEIKKCILLCSNCHREAHGGLWQPKQSNGRKIRVPRKALLSSMR